MTATSRGVVAGRVVEVRDHPHANLIRIALVDINIGRLLQIVFGGPPIVTSDCLVPVAPPGSRIGPQEKKLRRRNYRHVSSEGMLCSLAELGWDVNGPDQVAILRNVVPGESIDHFAGGAWRSHVDQSYFAAKRQHPVMPVLGPFRRAAFYEEIEGPKERVATYVEGASALSETPDGVGPTHVVFAGVVGRLLEKVTPAGVRTPAFCSSALLDAANGETVEEPRFGDDSGQPDAYLRMADDVGRVDWRTGHPLRIADVVTASGEDHDLCSRSILRRVQQELRARNGIDVLIGLELEVFVLPRPIAHLTAAGEFRPGAEHRSYFKRVTDPRVVRFLNDVENAAAAAGVDATFGGSEFAPFQLEFTLGPSDPLRCADDLLLLRQILIESARPHDLYACLMPQPFEKGFGAGLHINITAARDGEPMFLMTGGRAGPAADILAFADSLESHIQGACAVWNPTVNSYRRLSNVEFAKTSAFVLEGRRDSLLRVTGSPGDRVARLELRVPDGMVNPYAAIAICLGLLEESIGQAVERFGATCRLPESLEAAVTALQGDKKLRDILGARWLNVYRNIKLEELAWLRRRAEFGELALGDFVLSAPEIVAGLVEERLS